MRWMAGLVALVLAAGAAAADPVGAYSVQGRNPGGGESYSGTVVVQKTGDTFQVIWDINGETFVGTGVGNSEFLAVGYSSNNFNGLAMYLAKGGNWDGIWTATGGRRIGTEVWTRK